MLLMENTMRIRLIFEDREEILSPNQNLEGLHQCWLLLKPQQHKTIADIAAHIFHGFQLQTSCPHGILLCIDGYALPPFESTGILSISDTISVRKKRGILSIEASQGMLLEGREVGITQPAKEGTLLLANKEFEEESGGYLRDELVVLEGGVNATSKKRKASVNLHRSQKKKQYSAAQGNVQDDATTSQVQKVGQDKIQSSQELCRKNKKQAKNGNHKFDSDSMEISVNTESSDETQNTEDDALEGHVGTRKISRSAHRKKAKRQWLRELKVQKQTEIVQPKQTEIVQPKQTEVIQPKQTEIVQPKEPVSSDETQNNEDDALEGHVETKKNSRSARRKKAKRQWLRESAKVQKQTEIVQPKGLQISEETLSKADTSQPKQRGEQKQGKSQRENRKQKSAKHDRKEDDGEPKGLLYWKSSSAKDKFDDKKKNGEADQNDGNTCKQANQHSNTDEEVVPVVLRPEQIQVNQHSDTDDEVAPVVIRPGHIRFEPLDKDQDVEQSYKSREHFIQWNGITNKKKGQKWGMEKYVYSNRKDHNVTQELDAEMLTIQDDIKKVETEVLTTQDQQKIVGAEVLVAQDQTHKVGAEVQSAHNEIHLVNTVDFDKLPSLCNLPKICFSWLVLSLLIMAGDVIGYRLLELSSSWTPEISPFRVGQVSWCSETGKLLLMPIPEYPIASLKSVEDESDPQTDESLYNEDGSLEIDFSALVDVRMLKGGSGAALASVVPIDNAALVVPSASNDKQSNVSTPENGELHPGEVKKGSSTGNGVDLWEQVSEALSAKKAELSQESAYTEAISSKNSWSYRTLKGSALGPTMALLRSSNKL